MANNLPSRRTETVEDLTLAEMPKQWRMSERTLENVRTSVAMANTKHGLYASIPMVCKAQECPYASVCPMLEAAMVQKGDRCPIEIGQILTRFEAYKAELDIDPENIVDMSLVKDLIDIDIQLLRADNKLAIDADFIQEIVIAVTEGGDEITNPAIHKAVEYKEKLLKKRHDILQLLHSTRKDKAGDKLTITLDPSTYAAQLMAQAQQMRQSDHQVIDVDVEEVDE